MFMHICLHLDDVIIPWEPTNRGDFVAQILFDSRLQHGFDGLSSISGSKVMANQAESY